MKLKFFKYFCAVIFISVLVYSSLVLVKQGKEKSKNINIEATELNEFSEEEYVKIREEFITLQIKENPKIALTKLREDIKTNEKLARKCHALAHTLGHEGYEKYSDFGQALKFQDEICNSGYIHGVIESHFKKSSDLEKEMQVICSSYPLGKFLSWQCYHGVGHGFMYYTQNDLPKSLSYCEKYKNTFAKYSCTNGVFMENFNADDRVHKSKYVREPESFYPCNEGYNDYSNDCYLYIPTHYLSYNKGKYKEALKWCESAKNSYSLVCYSGVGSQAMKENLNNPKFVEEVCMSGNEEQKSACMGGMSSLYVHHLGAIEPAIEMCSKLLEENKAICLNVVAGYKEFFD